MDIKDFRARFDDELNNMAVYVTQKVVKDWPKCKAAFDTIVKSIQSIWYERKTYERIEDSWSEKSLRNYIYKNLRFRARDVCLEDIYPRNWLPGAKTKLRKRLKADKEQRQDIQQNSSAIAVKPGGGNPIEDQDEISIIASSNPNPEAAFLEKELVLIVNEAISQLPEQERFVITERFAHGNKNKDIAEDLGITPARASQIYKKALERLKASPTLQEVMVDV